MKIEKNQRYFTICVYAIISTIVVILATIVFLKWSKIWLYLSGILMRLFNLIKPLILAGVFAYLMDPIIEFYDRKCINLPHFKKHPKQGQEAKEQGRLIPTLLGGATLVSIIGLGILTVTINIKEVLGKGNLNNLFQGINYYIQYFNTMLSKVNLWTSSSEIPFVSQEAINKAYGMVNKIVQNISNEVLEQLIAIGANLFNILLAFVIAFYFLNDKKKILKIWNNILEKMLTRKNLKEVCKIGRDIDYVFAGYIRGQLIDSLIVGILISIALTIIGVDFAIIIGLIAGVFNLIPYFGPVVGMILAGFIGAMGEMPIKGVYAIIAVVIIQQIDGWIIVPKVIGESVKLPPVIVLISVLLGGSVFGLTGMLLGVPIAAFIRVMMLRYCGDVFK